MFSAPFIALSSCPNILGSPQEPCLKETCEFMGIDRTARIEINQKRPVSKETGPLSKNKGKLVSRYLDLAARSKNGVWQQTIEFCDLGRVSVISRRKLCDRITRNRPNYLDVARVRT